MSRPACHSQKLILAVSLVSMLGLAAGVANADITSGLVGYYPLDEGAGAVAYDRSGNGHDGTLYNGIKWISQAHQGGGVNCDGTTNTRIDLGTWNPAEGTGQLSLAMWIRWSGSSATYQGLIGKRDTWPDTTMFQFQVRPESGGTFRLETGSQAIVSPSNTLSPLIATWAHVAATFDGTTARLYLNGQQVASGAFSFYAAGAASHLGIGCVTGGGAPYSGNGEGLSGDMDEAFIYNRGLDAEEVPLVMAGYIGDKASNPSPRDGAADIPCDSLLSWSPMETATTRDVYFGTAYNNVKDATRADPKGVLVGKGQTATTFDPGALEYGQTYYWRIDEISAPPASAISTGRVWTFTVEPFSYPIESLTVKASSQQPASPASRTIDGSGLNAQNQHSDDIKQMWMSVGVPAWIQYTFDKEYKLDELWVWNANSQMETYMFFGAKDVAIEYSSDGQTWTPLQGVPQFAQGTGLPAYSVGTIVDFGGVAAKYVKLTIHSTWGNLMAASLSEVRFHYVPVQAREPDPADGATEVSLATDLIWRSGREAQSHEVYFGADAQAVAEGTVPTATQAARSYTPASLNYGTAYYWRVDEVGDAGTYEGELWSFTTQEYAVIEDFEGYDDKDNRIFDTWIDGWTNGTRSTVGYEESAQGTFGERTIVYNGSQSMPLQYDNATSPYYAEAEWEFATARNWTAGGAEALVFYLRGNAPGFMQTSDGQIIMNAKGTDIWDTADEFRYVYKNLNGNGTIVVRVDTLVRSDGWAKAGVMIRESLHPGSKHALVCMTPDYGYSFQQRPETGNVMDHASQVSVAGTGVVAPHWVKLTRTGSVFTAQQSADGVTWTDITFASPVNISMADSVLIGLAVTSHNAAVATAAEFSNLSTTGNVTGQWQVAEIGAEQPVGNAAESMYVRIEDAAGASVTVVNADEAVALRPTWRAWTIPYSDLAGVNLSKVRTMCIGVGNRSQPTAGGAGIVYIDDVSLGRPVQ